MDKNLKIAFQVNQMSLRGTEVAIYDYAHYNETLLGNTSIIIYDGQNPENHLEVLAKFENRFPLFAYEKYMEVEKILDEQKVDLYHVLKSGEKDEKVSHKVPTLVHAVFPTYRENFHGSVYVFISDWLSKHCSNGKVKAVPHMITLPDENGDLREELGIPKDATVFGCLGGPQSFDVKFVKNKVVPKIIQFRSDIHFVFLNIDSFMDHERVHFLPGTSDLIRKVQFINTADAMLHARKLGESFGIACGEYSIRNKPVITYSRVPQRNHLMVLGEKAIRYGGPRGLYRILDRFDRVAVRKENWDVYSERFSPERVMKDFEENLIKGLKPESLKMSMVDAWLVDMNIKTSKLMTYFKRLCW